MSFNIMAGEKQKLIRNKSRAPTLDNPQRFSTERKM